MISFLRKITYNLFINPFTLLFLLPVVLLHDKLRASFLGKRGIWPRIEKISRQRAFQKPLIWFHAASAGEFLQAKPVIDKFHQAGWFCFLSLTSVSGYSWLKQKDPEEIDAFEYLPLDFIHNNIKIIKKLNPRAIVFSKTDLWPNLVDTAAFLKVPLFVIGARTPKNKISAFYYRSLYKYFSGVYTATDADAQFWSKQFEKHSPKPSIKALGDSRFDTVAKHGRQLKKFTWKFDNPKSRTVVLGSVWPKDIAAITEALTGAMLQYPQLRIIAAPHEIDRSHIQTITGAFSQFTSRLYSTIRKKDIITERVIIVDTIGDLHALYSLAQVAYVGGGFSKGIHNILEPASMGAAVIFGPKHESFPEAFEMKHHKAARSGANADELTRALVELLGNTKLLKEMQQNALEYVQERANTAQPYFNAITAKL